MSCYGLKIKNIEAGVLYEYNLGVRNHYDYTNAMFIKSLFYDFLIDNGLNVWKEESTRDIVCIKFGFGSSSYTDQVKKIEKQIKNESDEIRLSNLNEILKRTHENKDKYIKKTAQELREEFYTNGVSIEYTIKDKKGNVKNSETIHYKMLYRTPGKAKEGSCMFINEKLYDIAVDFLRMGIKLPETNSPIVEIGAYSSLITSSIVGKININPENILVLNDVDSFFETNVVSVETNDKKQCILDKIDKYKLKNTLFDGQALIDSSIFPEWGDGYILLRHHFCKMAAFNTNIQRFFIDYFGEKYENATIKDMFGHEHFAKDIKLITTDNAMKWLKFDVSYEYWCKKVHENGDMFGIVKTAHKSKLGEVQKMSYQMINALSLEIMPEVVKTSVNYIQELKNNDDVFMQYLKENVNFSNDFDALIDLCKQDPEFIRSEYFRERKKKIIEAYILNFKNGKIIQNADNLVIVGSPYAMLLHSVGEDAFKDDTFKVEGNCIQCHTKRFDDGEYLAEFRSPFNSKNNLGYLHNVYDYRFDKYFNFGEQIIAINMIGTDFQDRNNGSDQDSDSIYVTNQKDIVEYAGYCYANFPTIVNNIPKEKNSYNNTPQDFARIDSNLAAANMAIGESSNLAQLALTYTYNFDDQKYIDYVCILSVLAQVAIDNAKRRFDIDLNKEISRIKRDMNIDENKYPVFWMLLKRKNKFSKKNIKEDKSPEERKEERIKWNKKINFNLQCPMNYLYNIKFEKNRSPYSTLPMSHFFVKFEMENSRRRSIKVEKLIEKYSIELYNERICNDNTNYLLLRNDFDELIEDIRNTYISTTYLGLMSWLIDRAFCISDGAKRNKQSLQSTINKNKSLLIKVLYDVNKNNLLKVFSKNITQQQADNNVI